MLCNNKFQPKIVKEKSLHTYREGTTMLPSRSITSVVLCVDPMHGYILDEGQVRLKGSLWCRIPCCGVRCWFRLEA